ncbi:MAG: rhodanese-like domain-containing protein [Halofilum sp. (in: g-proteobacteria)]|nr:rhodanese-like domain-containing protein [Halofilum sp. (in: g-proteobacteria)]
MSGAPYLPLLLDPARLAEHLDDPALRIVDLSPAEVFREHHVPGSVHLPYASLVASAPPVGGLLPDTATLERVLAAAGIGGDTHVVALDAEGGGAAGRLLWTLEALGHAQVSLLDGGLPAWVNEGYPVASGAAAPAAATRFRAAAADATNVARAEDILARLDDADFATLDARSPASSTAPRCAPRAAVTSRRAPLRVDAGHGTGGATCACARSPRSAPSSTISGSPGPRGGRQLPHPPPLGVQLRPPAHPRLSPRPRLPRLLVGLGQPRRHPGRNGCMKLHVPA